MLKDMGQITLVFLKSRSIASFLNPDQQLGSPFTRHMYCYLGQWMEMKYHPKDCCYFINCFRFNILLFDGRFCLISFLWSQILSTRAKKNAVMNEIKVDVCIFAFDILYLNGQPLLREQLNIRREVCYVVLGQISIFPFTVR